MHFCLIQTTFWQGNTLHNSPESVTSLLQRDGEADRRLGDKDRLIGDADLRDGDADLLGGDIERRMGETEALGKTEPPVGATPRRLWGGLSGGELSR